MLSEFAYYVPRTLNRTAPAYRRSVKYLKRTVPLHRTRISLQKRHIIPAYRTSYKKMRRTVPYLRIIPYRTAIPAFKYLLLYLTLKSLADKSQFTHFAFASAIFCFCIQKAGAMCKKSGIFKPLRIQLKCCSGFRSNFSAIYGMPR